MRNFIKGLYENKEMFLGTFQLLKQHLDKEYDKNKLKLKLKSETNVLNAV